MWNVEAKRLMVRETFYSLAKVEDAIRYDIGETLMEMRYSDHYGPWYHKLMKYYNIRE